MPEHPLKTFEDLDPKLLELVNNTRDLALADGALPRKIKLLIAMVLDAVALVLLLALLEIHYCIHVKE